jgi:class 3 adenylate cyclase
LTSFERAFQERYNQSVELSQSAVKAREAAAADHPGFGDLVLGETRRGEGAIMFLDIRGYTRLAMAFADQPEETAKIIDAVVGGAVEVLPRYGAHINDFTGDGIMAVFGGELGSLDHAHDLSIWAAVNLMNQMSATLRAELLGVAIEDPVRVAIGLVSGPILWKCVGSEKDHRVMAIGEVAPLASKYVTSKETNAWQTMIGGDVIDAVPPEFREKAPDYTHTYMGTKISRERWLLDTETFGDSASSTDDIVRLRTLAAVAAMPMEPAAKPRIRRGDGGQPERTIG